MAKIKFLKIGKTPSSLADVPAPNDFSMSYSDISASDCGRTQDGIMHKNTIARKRKIQLSWKNRSAEVVSYILKAVKPEYFHVRFLDAEENKYVTGQFYVGDRTVQTHSVTINGTTYSQLSFNIVEV